MAQLLDYTLTESYEAVGVWWLPSEPTQTRVGQVRYVPGEAIELNLYGSFAEFPKVDRFEASVIVGVVDGMRCTLFDCFQVSFNFGSPGFTAAKMLAGMLALGEHFEDTDGLRFTSMSCTFENLEEWVNERNVELTWDDPRAYSATYTRPEPREYRISTTPGKVSLQYATRVRNPGLNSVSLSANPVFVFRPDEALSFAQYRRLFLDLQHLLTLLMGHQTFLIYSIGYIQDRDEAGQKAMANMLQPQLVPEVRKRRSSEMALAYADVQESFGMLFDTWLGKAEVLRPTVDLLFSHLGRPEQYLHSTFLALVQAIENFHRTVHGGKYASDESYAPVLEKLRDAIPDDIDRGWRESLRNTLRFGNEYSLSKRLKELFKGLTEAQRSIVVTDHKRFLTDVVNTRNYLTHYSEDLKEKSLDNDGMFDASHRLMRFLAILLLRELGLADDQVVIAVKKSAFH